MIGSVGERMLQITLPYVRSWNVWHSDTGNSPAGVAPLLARVAAACAKVGRDPATVDATVVALVRMPGGVGRRQGDGYTDKTPNPIQGPPEVIAEELLAYARARSRWPRWRPSPRSWSCWTAAEKRERPADDRLAAPCDCHASWDWSR